MHVFGPPNDAEESHRLGRAPVHAMLAVADAKPGLVSDIVWMPYTPLGIRRRSRQREDFTQLSSIISILAAARLASLRFDELFSDRRYVLEDLLSVATLLLISQLGICRVHLHGPSLRELCGDRQ